MKLGQCNCCGKKIGTKTANGVYLHGPEMRQIAIVYNYPSAVDPEDENARIPESRVHIPVCKACADAPDYEKIKLALNTKPEIVLFLRDPLKPQFSHFEKDPVKGGMVTGDA